MADSPSDPLLASLRAAARTGDDAYLVSVVDERERARASSALALEGKVAEEVMLADALALIAARPFEIAIVDPDRQPHDVDPVAALGELGLATDLVFLLDGGPGHIGDAFLRGATGVLPRPLPDSDALVSAHLRWLASGRRSRSRAASVRAAFARIREALKTAEPALHAAIAALVDDTASSLRLAVLGDGDLVRAAGGAVVETAPAVVVVGVSAPDLLAARLAEARGRATGAAVIVVDTAPQTDRAAAALYGGARAYLPRSMLSGLGRVVADVAARRHDEVAGRKLLDLLARYAVFDERRAAPAPPRDLDVRMIADATARGGPVVPSGHEVLVVDDEVVVLTVLREALRRGGYRVTTAASAEEAIELMKGRAFDLVLTDKNLTGASGLEVLRFARGLDPAPAVVLITGYSSYDSAVEALEIGALDYIEKPIKDVELLRQRIRRALSRRDEQISRTPPPETPTRRARVLLVEQEGGRRQLLADYLGRHYDVVAAADGEEALSKLQLDKFDMVLADRNLAGVSGLRVIEQAQRLLPHCASVLYTAYPSYESVKEAFEVGVDAYLVRPSEDMKALDDKVAGALRSRGGGILLG
jgi:CheY-like chemotaxis protein